MQINNPITMDHIILQSGETLLFTKLSIGAWDMWTNDTKNVAHGLSGTQWKTIIPLGVIIYNDDETFNYPISQGSNAGDPGLVGIRIVHINSTVIVLERRDGAIFQDPIEFDDGVMIRGYVYIAYEE